MSQLNFTQVCLTGKRDVSICDVLMWHLLITVSYKRVSSFQCHKNLKNLKQKIGKDSALSLLWIITQPLRTLNSCPACPRAMGPGWPNAPLAMDCFRSLPHCNALTREAPLRREKKAQRASDHYHREIINCFSFCELFFISAHKSWILKWKCKWRCHRMTLLHTQQ